jgi:flavin-binding protein dodecin
MGMDKEPSTCRDIVASKQERGRQLMSDHVYKIVELVGSSPTSIEDAIQSAVARASSTVDNIRWFEVLETRGHVDNGKVSHYQVTIKVGFTVKA